MMKMLKKGILTIMAGLVIVPFFGRSQVALEKVYNFSLTSTRINQTEYKYYLMDIPLSQCRIYNMDHSLWKTIPITLPSNYYLFDIKFVTQNLFNSDAAVELWYSAYEWVASGSSGGYYRYISKIIGENGNILASIPGGAYAYIIQAGPEKFKLAVYAYDNAVSPGSVQTYLFSLPDATSASQFVTAATEEPYPNPSSAYIRLPLPEGSADRTVKVISASGQLVFEKRTGREPEILLNTKDWAPGLYSGRIVQNGTVVNLGSFMVVH
jgi:hypothetical protein